MCVVVGVVFIGVVGVSCGCGCVCRRGRFVGWMVGAQKLRPAGPGPFHFIWEGIR